MSSREDHPVLDEIASLIELDGEIEGWSDVHRGYKHVMFHDREQNKRYEIVVRPIEEPSQ